MAEDGDEVQPLGRSSLRSPPRGGEPLPNGHDLHHGFSATTEVLIGSLVGGDELGRANSWSIVSELKDETWVCDLRAPLASPPL